MKNQKPAEQPLGIYCGKKRVCEVMLLETEIEQLERTAESEGKTFSEHVSQVIETGVRRLAAERGIVIEEAEQPKVTRRRWLVSSAAALAAGALVSVKALGAPNQAAPTPKLGAWALAGLKQAQELTFRDQQALLDDALRDYLESWFDAATGWDHETLELWLAEGMYPPEMHDRVRARIAQLKKDELVEFQERCQAELDAIEDDTPKDEWALAIEDNPDYSEFVQECVREHRQRQIAAAQAEVAP